MSTPATTTISIGDEFHEDGYDTWRDADGARHRHDYTHLIRITAQLDNSFAYDIIGVVAETDPPPATIRRNYKSGTVLRSSFMNWIVSGEIRRVG